MDRGDMESKKRSHSPDAGSGASHRYGSDSSLSLPSFSPAAPSERYNLPPLSSLTSFAAGGGPPPPPSLHGHMRRSGSEASPPPPVNSAKRLRLDDTGSVGSAGSRDRSQYGSPAGADDLGGGRRHYMHSMPELPGIASITGRPAQNPPAMPLFSPGAMPPSASSHDVDHRSILPSAGHRVVPEYTGTAPPTLPSLKSFSADALPERTRGSPVLSSHYAASDSTRYGPSGAPHYSSSASVLTPSGGTNAIVQSSPGLLSSNRMTLPPFNASSPVSKVPKPPATNLYKREGNATTSTSGTASTSVTSRGSPYQSPRLSPALNPTIATIPPPAASFLQAANGTGPAFAANPFGVSQYGPNYYPSAVKRLDYERKDIPSVLSRVPNPPSSAGEPSTPLGTSSSELHAVGALLHAASAGSPTDRDTGSGDGDLDESGAAGNSEDLESEDLRSGAALRRRTKGPDSEAGEPLGRVLIMGVRKADMEKAKEEAKRKRKPGDVAVVNDERLIKLPKNVEERFLGHVNYTGPRVKVPGSIRVEDIELFLLPQFTSEHHYSTIEVRIPAHLLTFKNNVAVRRSAVWGTDVYADDSDVVGMIIHSGWYKPIDSPVTKTVRALGLTTERREPETQIKQEPLSPNDEDKNGQQVSTTVEDSATQSSVPPETATVRVLPQPPPEPITGKVDPRDGLPDHDLHVTLRILPRLVKYSGSSRNGIESRGWGGLHDGESVRIENVVLADKGTVGRKGRKTGAKGWSAMARIVARELIAMEQGDDDGEGDWGWGTKEPAEGFGTVTFVFSDFDGEACLKYSPKLLIDWPPYLRDLFWDSETCLQRAREKGKHYADGTESASQRAQEIVQRRVEVQERKAEFTGEELRRMRDWPYWRIRMLKDTLFLEDGYGKRYELSRRKEGDSQAELYQLTECKGGLGRPTQPSPPAPAVHAENLGWQDLEWTEAGVAFANGERVAVARFFWRRQDRPVEQERKHLTPVERDRKRPREEESASEEGIDVEGQATAEAQHQSLPEQPVKRRRTEETASVESVTTAPTSMPQDSAASTPTSASDNSKVVANHAAPAGVQSPTSKTTSSPAIPALSAQPDVPSTTSLLPA
ncbi:uncharacterized protein SPPG_04356 [Spizellomyces punctatus DAOM BR117]|uniref:Histone deacetylation protein Rxt3 n=1 Tax=Spizellomyces punctatus (strain DAOM BR117) TaxID=645134 RepID=A0A0L0HGS1_SPIPD|nr:uncharacterized protein SPPG_04356 [Spizellomyces punctatus DAOM BR117]KND00009.1 hypothetical protein SPPG_04356 [Spizellomyces punctatus DAOM BR117]|eukprot:XP_016608048.1 hypothetical protein SPPG_04356 [Spizellomyces punctatus DAOM BR117]